MRFRLLATFLLATFLATFLATSTPAQEVLPFVPPNAEEVGEVLRYLASDDLAGRDTPSRGLSLAADFLEKGFREASLEPGVSNSYRHRYGVDVRTVKGSSARLTLHLADTARTLEPLDDFRIWEAAGPIEARDETPYFVSRIDASRNSERTSGWRSRPLFVEVKEDSAFWREAAAERSFLARRPRRAIVLVKEGVWPQDVRSVDLDIPDVEQHEMLVDNVVGIVRGKEKPEEFVVVTAHYDHVGVSLTETGEDVIFNGADDDATGTTAVLTLAQAFARSRPGRSIAFCCVSGEEKGLLGSRALAANPPFDLKKVVVNLNIEMIGRPPENGRFQAWITGDRLSNFRAIAEPELARADLETVDFAMGAMLFRASDNYAFAQRGIVAHTISAGSLHTDYHKPSDEFERIDLEHMTRVIRGIGHVLWRFSDPEVSFAYGAEGRKQLGLDR